jgi:hypothetical protein
VDAVNVHAIITTTTMADKLLSFNNQLIITAVVNNAHAQLHVDAINALATITLTVVVKSLFFNNLPIAIVDANNVLAPHHVDVHNVHVETATQTVVDKSLLFKVEIAITTIAAVNNVLAQPAVDARNAHALLHADVVNVPAVDQIITMVDKLSFFHHKILTITADVSNALVQLLVAVNNALAIATQIAADNLLSFHHKMQIIIVDVNNVRAQPAVDVVHAHVDHQIIVDQLYADFHPLHHHVIATTTIMAAASF